MRREILLVVMVGLLSMVSASGQEAARATVRTPLEELSLMVIDQAPNTLFPLAEIVESVGGEVQREGRGFRVLLGDREAFLGPDSRYAVLGDQIIEMPVLPIAAEGRLFVPWQLFRGLLQVVDLDAVWRPFDHVLEIHPLQREAVSADVSLVDLGNLTKIVIALSDAADVSVRRTDLEYVIRFRNPLRAPFREQAYSDPMVTRIRFEQNEIRIELRSPNVTASSYRLSDPVRIVLDLKSGEAPAPERVEPPFPPARAPRRTTDSPGVKIVVLDPGHGGKEVGAEGPTGLLEKELTLEICRKLRRELLRRGGMRVILTRSDDSLVPLDQRTALANQYNADLFLSVHLNSASYRNARGSETYFLSLEASDDRAALAAERENEGSDSAPVAPSSELDLILWDLAQQDYLKESSRFAEFVQDEMAVATGIEKRGVKQAPFRVLVGATMPAALVEVGFISNPEDEARLREAEFQELVVRALANAIDRYREEYETRVGMLGTPSSGDAAAARTATVPDSGTPRR